MAVTLVLKLKRKLKKFGTLINKLIRLVKWIEKPSLPMSNSLKVMLQCKRSFSTTEWIEFPTLVFVCGTMFQTKMTIKYTQLMKTFG